MKLTAFALGTLAGGALAAALGCRAAPTPPVPAAGATRTTMAEILRALQIALPLSLEEEAFRAPGAREPVLAALRSLAGNASALAIHGESPSPGFDYVGRTLVADAREAADRYQQGEYEAARFTIQQLTESCFACHSKLPSGEGIDLGAAFLADPRVASLPLQDRVRLEVVTRQFERALDGYEELLRSPRLAAGEIYLMGGFEDYLKIVLRVRSDAGRALAALQQFRARPDVPRYLDHHVASWIAALRGLEDLAREGDELARARQLIHGAQVEKQFPEDRRGLVRFVAASSLLHRYVAARPRQPAERAEAYYLLGVTEANISRASWLSETEFFLESAIRSDPRSPFARAAYAFLEEYVISGYTGSAGIHVPPSVREQLDGLQRLLNGS